VAEEASSGSRLERGDLAWSGGLVLVRRGEDGRDSEEDARAPTMTLAVC
jgi:hypothetical protein